MSLQFTQPCPTCGRRIRVQASLMGHSVACPHCNAQFNANAVARDGRTKTNHLVDTRPHDPLMARVEKALAQVDDTPTVPN